MLGKEYRSMPIKTVINKVILLMTAMTVICGLALAADIDGKWTAELQGRGGATQTQTLTLTANGGTLTGSLTGGRGGTVDISDGTIDSSNNVSFKVVREFNGNQVTQEYKGTLSGSELKLSISRGGGGGGRRGRGGQMQLVFKKAAN
jgi:hypothetical protein